jgi:predicted nucleic acid-binding protein
MESYVLDTSALIALRENETGADVVEAILRKAQSKKVRVFISFISMMEIFYCSWRAEGKAAAHRIFLELKMLPLQRVDVNDNLLFLAGEIKGTCSLSLADSWIAATAVHQEAVLIHKDPEFEQLEDRLSLQALPYK